MDSDDTENLPKKVCNQEAKKRAANLAHNRQILENNNQTDNVICVLNDRPMSSNSDKSFLEHTSISQRSNLSANLHDENNMSKHVVRLRSKLNQSDKDRLTLQSNLDLAKHEIERLKKKVEELENTIAADATRFIAQDEKISQLTDRLSKAGDCHEQLQSEYQRITELREQEINRLRSEIDQWKMLAQDLQATSIAKNVDASIATEQVEFVDGFTQDERDQTQQLREQTERLCSIVRQSLDNLEEKNPLLEHLDGKIQRVQNMLAAFDEKMSEKIQNLENKNRNIQSELFERDTELASLKSERDNHHAELEDARTAAEVRVKALATKHDVALAEKDNQIDNLRQEINLITARCSDAENKLRFLIETKQPVLSVENRSSKETVHSISEEHVTSHSEVVQQDKATQSQIDEQQVAELKDDITQMQCAHENEVTELRAKLELFKRLHISDKTKIEELNEEVQERDRYIYSLECRREEATSPNGICDEACHYRKIILHFLQVLDHDQEVDKKNHQIQYDFHKGIKHLLECSLEGDVRTCIQKFENKYGQFSRRFAAHDTKDGQLREQIRHTGTEQACKNCHLLERRIARLEWMESRLDQLQTEIEDYKEKNEEKETIINTLNLHVIKQEQTIGHLQRQYEKQAIKLAKIKGE